MVTWYTDANFLLVTNHSIRIPRKLEFYWSHANANAKTWPFLWKRRSCSLGLSVLVTSVWSEWPKEWDTSFLSHPPSNHIFAHMKCRKYWVHITFLGKKGLELPPHPPLPIKVAHSVCELIPAENTVLVHFDKLKMVNRLLGCANKTLPPACEITVSLI